MLTYNVTARAYLRKVHDECVDQRRFIDQAVRAVDRILVEADELIELVDSVIQRSLQIDR
jgi:hypothetical protein